MHTIEPFFNWRKYYIASEDERSPFYKYQNSEISFTHTVYNYYIHPQWGAFDAATLFCKVLYTNYENKYTIIELMGEWNDCTHLDIKFFKRNVIEKMLNEGINKFILIGESVFNFFATTDGYYEEWYEELEGGWIYAMNFQSHVLKEFRDFNLQYYFILDDEFEEIFWRTLPPWKVFEKISASISTNLYLE